MRPFDLALALSGLALVGGAGAQKATAQPVPAADPRAISTPVSRLESPGREVDARAARIAFRLATAGVGHCPTTRPALGLVLQHLTQFELPDRPGLVAGAALDRGPGVVVVVPGSPADTAGVHAGDVLLAVDGGAVPREERLDLPFAATRAHARADAVTDLLERGGTSTLTLLRDGGTVTVHARALPACPSRVHLARSAQRNAYADGTHVFLTTGFVAGLKSDDEVAFIIAHEMAHNVLGHAAVMRGGTVRRGIARGIGSSGRIVRAAEDAADALGGDLMLDAGFDPVAGAALLRRFGGLDLFGTHGSAETRIAAMRALAGARRTR